MITIKDFFSSWHSFAFLVAFIRSTIKFFSTRNRERESPFVFKGVYDAQPVKFERLVKRSKKDCPFSFDCVLKCKTIDAKHTTHLLKNNNAAHVAAAPLHGWGDTEIHRLAS